MAKDSKEAFQFHRTCIELQCEQGLLLSPHLIRLEELGVTGFKAHREVDSALFGDVPAASWNHFTLGHFNLQQLVQYLLPSEPPTLVGRYSEFGLRDADDHLGFYQVFDIPCAIGKEVRAFDHDCNWVLTHRSLLTPMSAKSTLNSGRRWPLMQETGTAPSEGNRVTHLGGLQRFQNIDHPDDGYSSDAIWRSSPSVIWRIALRTALATRAANRRPADIEPDNAMIPTHTGVRPVQDLQRSSVALLGRRLRRCLRQFNQLSWPHVVLPFRARSVDLGSGCNIGRVSYKPIDPYPGASASSVRSVVVDVDFHGILHGRLHFATDCVLRIGSITWGESVAPPPFLFTSNVCGTPEVHSIKACSTALVYLSYMNSFG